MDKRQFTDTILKNVEEITAFQELHKSARVITIKGWIALVFAALFFVCVVVWAFIGKLPIIAAGKSILLENQRVLGFFSLYSGQQIQKGMYATVSLDTVDSARFGRIKGVVREVSIYPVSANDLLEIPSQPLRGYLTAGKLPTIMVEIELLKDEKTKTGLQWTTQTGPQEPLLEGSVGEAEVTLKIIRPINYVIPKV